MLQISISQPTCAVRDRRRYQSINQNAQINKGAEEIISQSTYSGKNLYRRKYQTFNQYSQVNTGTGTDENINQSTNILDYR
jgi:hypothetical protein